MNAIVKSWLYSTVTHDLVESVITHDLAESIITHDSNAHNAWVAIKEYFLGNQETRTLHLDAKFCFFA